MHSKIVMLILECTRLFVMIKRQLESRISVFKSGKATIVIGPRQVGKTTLVKEILKGKNFLFLDGDDPTIRQLLENINTRQIKDLLGENKIVFIDECQRIKNIGLTSKIITDQFSGVHLILSGSSAFEISGETGEPLTGRKKVFKLLPVSFHEWAIYEGLSVAIQDVKIRLVYGFYPEILTEEDDRVETITEIAQTYLYKDILSYANIKFPDVVEKLVRALAYQIGNEVNYNELSNLLKIDYKTVVNYIDILEKSFVVFRLSSFSTNQRVEIRKGVKIYFYDLGIRNALIQNFSPIELRNDVGALWENFVIAERIKQIIYSRQNINSYFWRTTQNQEIDYIEEHNGTIKAFEIKWKNRKVTGPSKSFSKYYDASFEVIHPENFFSYVKEI